MVVEFLNNLRQLDWICLGIAAGALSFLALRQRRLSSVRKTVTLGMDLLQAQDFSSRLAPVGTKEGDRIVRMFNNMISSLKEQRLKVREQNHLLDLLMAASPMGVLMFDGNSRLTMANAAAREMTGIPNDWQYGDFYSDNIPGPLGESLARLQEGESATVRTGDSMVYRCSRLHFIDKGYPHPFFLIELLTEEVRMAERRGYEKVIRTMAHEVNNSMGAVVSTLDTAAYLSTDKDFHNLLEICSQRCRDMSEFISSYARVVKIPEARKVPVSLNSFLKDTLPMLQVLCSEKDIDIVFVPSDIEMDVYLDPVQMEQVLINLVKNSVESICKKGIIRIVADRAGFYVEDNGAGISTETAAQLFTPFYTTKPDGNGIGLMIVTDILRKHGFRFSFATDSDGLTCFRIKI